MPVVAAGSAGLILFYMALCVYIKESIRLLIVNPLAGGHQAVLVHVIGFSAAVHKLFTDDQTVFIQIIKVFGFLIGDEGVCDHCANAIFVKVVVQAIDFFIGGIGQKFAVLADIKLTIDPGAGLLLCGGSGIVISHQITGDRSIFFFNEVIVLPVCCLPDLSFCAGEF